MRSKVIKPRLYENGRPKQNIITKIKIISLQPGCSTCIVHVVAFSILHNECVPLCKPPHFLSKVQSSTFYRCCLPKNWMGLEGGVVLCLCYLPEMVNLAPIAGGGKFRYNLHSSLPKPP